MNEIKKITDKLFSLQDKKYRDFQTKLIPGAKADDFIGVRTPDLRALAKELLREENIGEFLNDLPNGIDTVIGEHGDKLSGGQKQRITIARALIRDPAILILDEATSALDNISEYHVQKAIASSIKGRTTFIVAHRLSTIRDADRIIVMSCTVTAISLRLCPWTVSR